MAKGIIVVDMPDYCDLCPLGRIFGMTGGVECMIAPSGRRVAGYGFHLEKPDWCPIREAPVKKPEKDYTPSMDHHYFDGYEDGWNDCVDYLEI